MKRWMWLLLVIISLLVGGGTLCLGCTMAVSLFGYPLPIQDYLDQRSLRQQFDLPPGPKPVEYHGFPAETGFGQREGLNIRAIYQLPENQTENFRMKLTKNGWLPLPIPPETSDKIRPYVTPDTLELSSGLYFCRTVGNNILHARETHPCADLERLNDVIFGAYDANTKHLFLQVGSGY